MQLGPGDGCARHPLRLQRRWGRGTLYEPGQVFFLKRTELILSPLSWLPLTCTWLGTRGSVIVSVRVLCVGTRGVGEALFTAARWRTALWKVPPHWSKETPACDAAQFHSEDKVLVP